MRKIICLTVVLGILLSIQPAFAASGWTKSSRYKLKRGITNIFSAPLEIPYQITDSWKQGRERSKLPIIWLINGVARGVGQTVLRAGTGIWDTFTFNLEIPKGYRPIMEPEYVWGEGQQAETVTQE